MLKATAATAATAERWLWSVISGSSVDSAKQALINGANPNFLNPERGETAVHSVIRDGNLEMVQLLIHGLPNQQTQLADLNAVTQKFESCIMVASKWTSQNKIAIMQEILLNRSVCDRNLLDEYVYVCANALLGKKNLSENDFGLLSHYASRLCGENIGKIINENNNDDRYLIHLCQYSGAKIYNKTMKDNNELEGWSAYEFLPIRIYSLFEILVKLEVGAICVEAKEGWCEILRKEILTEIQTFKIEQERASIERESAFDNNERENLYSILANRFVENIMQNAGREFCLASAYRGRGHAIYIAFTFEKDSDALIIRYDNLGVGIENRHPIEGEIVYSKVIKLENITSRINIIKRYIVSLFLINATRLPDVPAKNASKEERESAKLHYKQEREKILSEIYDDKNQLGYIDVSSQQFGMSKQRAATCAATSHQVGLLFRLKDENFYQWVLSEEKRCIVQAGRKQGALASNVFWSVTTNDFKVTQYFDYCSNREIDIFIGSQHIIRELCIAESIDNFSFYEHLRRIFDKDDYVEFKLLCQSFEQINPDNQKIPGGLLALLWLKLGLKEEGLVDKFRFLNKSREILEFALKSNHYNDKLSSLYFNYFLGLNFYTLSQFDLAQASFAKCYNLTIKFLSNLDNSPYNLGQQFSDFAPKLQALKINTEMAQGFLYIEQEKYTDAAMKLEATATKSSMHNGMNYIGQIFTCYPTEALFGLGIIKYLETISMQTADLRKDGLQIARNYFIGIENKTSKIFYKTQEYLKKIQIELLELSKSQLELQTNNIQPITHLHNARKSSVLSDSEEQQDVKRRRMEPPS